MLNDSTEGQGVPLGMSVMLAEYLAPDVSASHVSLREEPDEDDEDEDEEDDGNKDGDDNEDSEDGDDDGYSP